MEVTAQPMSSVNSAFLKRLIIFYSPKRFNDKSTQFDMGYEQCKRDLRNLVHHLVPVTKDLEQFDAPTEITQSAQPEQSRWRLFGKQR